MTMLIAESQKTLVWLGDTIILERCDMYTKSRISVLSLLEDRISVLALLKGSIGVLALVKDRISVLSLLIHWCYKP
jgi:hypothetical protein